MKKLALALVCLVSVAFFASCEKPAGNPTINFVQGEGYISANDTVEDWIPFTYGIQAKSNETTKELLTDCHIQITKDETSYWDTVFKSINHDQYNFEERISFPEEGVYTISASVQNTAGNSAECSMNITCIHPDSLIEARDFEWYRWGNHEQHGLEEFGLYWDRNRNAIILPTEGTTLCTGLTKEQWDAVNTINEKIDFLMEIINNPQYQATQYTGISTNGSGPVGDVILTLMEEGECHLIYIDKIQFGEYGTYGYPMTVTGQVK